MLNAKHNQQIFTTQINRCRSVVPVPEAAGGEKSVVSSQTVVKMQSFSYPASFAQLECNTDLNLPPSNWLTNSANSYGLQQALSHSTGFTRY